MSHKSNRLFISLILALVISLAGIGPVMAAGECYVKWNASGSNNGLSWTNAYTDLQSALGNAACTEIWVAAGTYKPGAARTDTFTLKNGVSIYGGFAGTETLRTQRSPAVNVTILSGDIDGNDSQTPIITDPATVTGNTTNSYHVVNGGSTDSTAMLDGFTITAGNANSTNPDNCGGGMYNHSGSPTLRNMTFSGNTGGYCGGGMYNIYGNPNLANVTISGNSAGNDGGGMYNTNGGPSLTNVTFSGNSATKGGGGMYNYGGNPSLTNVTFSGNSATSATSVGGGIANSFSNPTLTNVTISGNSAGNNGGGMYNKSSNTTFTTLKNVIIWGNTAPYGSEISDYYVEPSSTLTITYSVIRGGYTGTGNISSDPLLGVLANNGGYAQTMALGAGSSAIDTGTNTGCPATDQRGVTRPQGSQCDIGAYEYNVEVPPGAFNKSAPSNGATNQSTSPTLSWGSSSDATNYDYCYDTTNDNACSGWTSNGSSTSKSLSGLSYSTTYYWHVRATNSNGTTYSNGSSTAFWSLTTQIIDNTYPIVSSIARADTSPTSATSVDFTVMFSESVTGVTIDDFALYTTSVTGATISGMSGSGTTYTATVNTGSGNGTIRLDVVDDDSIVDGDGNQLGGSGIGNGNFAGGEVYIIEKTYTFQSIATQDGHLFELSENSNTGWKSNTNSSRFYVGDDHRDRQYLAILSFDTSSLPDDAVILSATLNVKRMRTVGTNPFDTHGNLGVEIGSPCFGSSCNLENPDFQASAQDVAGILSSFSVDNWHSAPLGANVFPYINPTGTTQFRLRFELDDNDDGGMDAIQFLSGNASPDDRPQLKIEYTVP